MININISSSIKTQGGTNIMNYDLTTGNHIVDAVGDLEFKGNIIPAQWYQTITDAKGHAHFIAINILSEIVYWYRPTIETNINGEIISVKKKFKDKDFIQLGYHQICKKYNISAKQAREALKKLESLHIIKRHLRTIDSSAGYLSNVLFIELFPERLKDITQKDNSCLLSEIQVLSQKEIPIYEEGNTNTDNTTDNSTVNTTTYEVVANLLEPFNISKKDIIKIIEVSDQNVDKIEAAVKVLDGTTSVNNITGFLISAIKNNYQRISKNDPTANSFLDFKQRKYDYEALEKDLQ